MSDEELEKGLDEIFKEDTQAIRESMKSLMRSYDNALGELVKKDKVIDLMALHIASSAIVDDMVCMYKDCENENCTADMSIQCTKEYFFEKVEEEK